MVGPREALFMANRRARVMSLFGLREFRVGLETALGNIHALVLLFLGDPDTKRLLDGESEHEARDEYPGKNRHDSYELGTQRRVRVRKADR